MSQHDYNLANASGAAYRADDNAMAGAIVTWNSGSSAPSPTFANMRWYDTANNRIWLRDNANTAWLPWFELGADGRLTIGPGVNNQDAVRILGTGGQRLLFRIDSGGNGKIAVYDSTGVAKVAIVGSGGGRVFVQGDEGTGRQIGAIQSSSELTIATSGQVLTVAHSLGVRPRWFAGYYRCATAEFGYAVGDETMVAGEITSNNGSSVAADATNIYWITGNNNPVRILRRDAGNLGVSQSGTPANWRGIVRWTI